MYNFPISYEEPVFRPPSEWRSLLIQVTIGCSNNKCTYCDMYRSKVYRERSFEDIKADIHKCAKAGVRPEKVFLCDGDALGAPTSLLVKVLKEIKLQFPENRRVGVYATAENILEKSEEDLIELHDLGEQRGRDVGAAHGQARVTGIGFFHRVHGKGTDGIGHIVGGGCIGHGLARFW